VSQLFCVLLILLVPFAIAGLAIINTGLGRARSAAHSMMASLCVAAVAAGVFFVCGFAWEGLAGGPAHIATLGGKGWNWLGAERWFFRGIALDGSPVSLVVLLELFSVGLAALIPVGSGAERWRLGSCFASTALFGGWTYPLFAHWIWGGGWLAQLGTNYGLGHGFLDAGGSSAIQAVGGLTALSIAWILKPRRGKYASEGMPAAIPGHNATYVLFGCVLTLVGWIGMNSAGAILFTGAEPGRVVLVAVNTIMAAISALLAAALITRIRFGKPDASLSANGWVAGLAASSAGCAVLVPAESVVVGLIAGALTPFCVEWLELYLSVDDPGGAISVHAIGGIWGVLAVGIFAPGPEGQLMAQLVGIATLLGCMLPMTYGLNWLLNWVSPQRVAPEAERHGMDLYELGAGAYPEFLSHDEFSAR